MRNRDKNCLCYARKKVFFSYEVNLHARMIDNFLSRFNIKKGKIEGTRGVFGGFWSLKLQHQFWKISALILFFGFTLDFSYFPMSVHRRSPKTSANSSSPFNHPQKATNFFNVLLIVFSPKMNLFSKVSVKRITSHNQRFSPPKTDNGTSFPDCPPGGAA